MLDFEPNDFLYCFTCYTEQAKRPNRKKWKEWTQETEPNAIVWRQETRDVIQAYCEKHQRLLPPSRKVWHQVANHESWKFATFNNRRYKGPT